MARSDVSRDQLHGVEDGIAQILDARLALIQIEAVIEANLRYGHITEAEVVKLLDLTAQIRKGIENGLRFGRLVRNPPADRPDLEQLLDLLADGP